MDVRNCKSCGKMFNFVGKPLCPSCLNALEDKFQEVKKYVQDHPEANIQTVAEENEVTVQQIRTWIRQERLAFSDASQVGMNCEKCGVMIKTGRFCEKCKQDMGNEFSSLIKEPDVERIQRKKEAAKMHFLDK